MIKKDKNMLTVFDASKNNAGNQTKQQKKAKIDSYFDGREYRGFAVETLLIRENSEQYNPIFLQNAKNVYHMFKKLENLDRERFYTVVIDGTNKVIAVNLTFQGTLNQTLVHPREIFKITLLCSGAAIVLVHNHPSGKCDPSKEDFVITQQLVEVSKVLGIEIMDHVIIGYENYFSFTEKKILKNL